MFVVMYSAGTRRCFSVFADPAAASVFKIFSSRFLRFPKQANDLSEERHLIASTRAINR